jgi:inner membrane protein
MDPITHGVIGLALSTFSGQAPSVHSAITIGATLGAMAPDLDVVIRLFKDEMSYLKHHRGFSHSVPALIAGAGIITVVLGFMFSDMPWWQVWFWTFMGGLSHTAFDMLNSYGAMLFGKKRKFSLLTLYDPFISILALYLIFFRPTDWIVYVAVVLVLMAYLALRNIAKVFIQKQLETHFGKMHIVQQVDVLPGLKSFYKWDFIIKTNQQHIVGQINGMTGRVKVIEQLQHEAESYQITFEKTQLGAYLNEFSPNIHLKVETKEAFTIVTAVDLRYHYRNNFLHHGSMILDQDGKVVKSFLHPYKMHKRILVEEY